MALSKAFDCLPHDLLLQTLKYYGTSKSALNLIQNYLSNRKQCVKLGTANSIKYVARYLQRRTSEINLSASTF